MTAFKCYAHAARALLALVLAVSDVLTHDRVTVAVAATTAS
jgi:hypothetical protein